MASGVLEFLLQADAVGEAEREDFRGSERAAPGAKPDELALERRVKQKR